MAVILQCNFYTTIDLNNNKLLYDPVMSYQYEYPHPAVATDCVIFTFDGAQLQVLLIERGIEPFKGKWALPGGFVKIDESADDCARRELQEETGVYDCFLEQFGAYSAPDRDPRERVISIAYYALVKQQQVTGGDDAANAQWFYLKDVPQLAFDHDKILRDALARLRKDIHFKPIGFELLPEVFTMKELQSLYEAILDVRFDRRNFYKKMLHLDLLIAEEDDASESGKRQRIYYRFNVDNYNRLKQKGFRLEF